LRNVCIQTEFVIWEHNTVLYYLTGIISYRLILWYTLITGDEERNEGPNGRLHMIKGQLKVEGTALSITLFFRLKEA
jgi:hypothetical protein